MEETKAEELGRTYRCANCRSYGGQVKQIAATGTGVSRMIDFQFNEFIVVSCSFCGLVQMYDANIVGGNANGWRILDFLFGID